MDETQAIARIKQGELDGVETLVLRYQAKAVQAAYLVMRDRQAAEDVVQAAFLKAVERIGQFDDSRPFGPWFLRSVVNAAIDASQQQKRMLSLEDAAEGGRPALVDWLASGAPYPEDLVEEREARAEVRKALDALTPEQRAAVVLRHFLEMSEAEMSGVLRRPPSTVKWWLHTARKRLRELLAPARQAGRGE